MTSQKSLSNRIAEEAQLLSEEKWIIEALNKIKKQRNGLQIERLQLESLKAQMRTTDKSQVTKTKTPLQVSEEINTVNLMQSSSTQNRNLNEFELPVAWDSGDCNVEELNLTVSNAVLSSQLDSTDNMQFATEEEEDEDEVYLDINLLMDAAKD